MRSRHVTAVIGVVAVLLVSCAATSEQDAAQQDTPAAGATEAVTSSPPPAAQEAPTPEETEPPDDTALSESDDEGRQWTSCEHPDGITVEYPADWHVNAGDTLPACSAFDPEPLDVPEAQEFFGAAALLSVEPVDFATISDPEARAGEVLDERQASVDGHDARRVETEARGDALLEDGTRSIQWLIALGRDETLTLTTHEVDDAETYEEHRDVIDEIVTRLELPASG